ncbi:polysaccharide biosynthesis tyrosine autokinase [Pantoea ananatis]|uniref:polysaccharide biosynthesis tyrosine autokinase n=1 Tax=Pantoea ananas TaxID=553 RepID=UPI001B313214|nr:polysaccharide biosynthesis tyrosine autokinase [Pantoea ananatis]
MSASGITKEKNKSKSDMLDLNKLSGDIINGRWFILSFVVIVTILSVVYVFFASPVYQANALIQIEEKQGNALLNNFNSIFPGGQVSSIPEIQIIQSRMILGKTVDDLNLQNVVNKRYFPLLGEGWSRISNAKEDTISLASLEMSDVRRAGKENIKLTVTGQSEYRVEGDGFIIDGSTGRTLKAKGFNINVADIQAPPGSVFIIQQKQRLVAINDLQEELSVVDKGKDSGILALSLNGKDPVLTQQTLRKITENYLAQNVARQAAQDATSLAFLQGKLPEIKEKLNAAEAKLNRYRQKKDSVDLSLEAQSALNQIVNIENQLNELVFKEAEISQLFKKDHPGYKALLEKRETLENEKKRVSERISQMPATQQEVLRLSRDVDSGQAIYMQLLMREQELNIAKSSAIGNVRIIDEAVTQPEAVKPKKVLIILFSSALSLFVSVCLVVIRGLLHKRIESPEQLEDHGITVYAAIPHSEWLQKKSHFRQRRFWGEKRISHSINPELFLSLSNPADLAIEAIRSLHTSLHFAMLQAGNNIVMVSGATPDSGKTFASSNLAAVMAQSGKRVLFIDADLRKGYSHRLFRAENKVGLTDMLSKGVNARDVIQTLNPAGFDFISRGAVPSNPTSLLLRDDFRHLIMELSQAYDVVIMDTPPVLAVADAAIAGRCAGTVLLVARAEFNNIKEIEISISRLAQNGVQVSGVILNDILKKAGSYYKYGYGEYAYSAADE